jgi:hypothetical protein
MTASSEADPLPPILTSRTVTSKHIRIESSKPFRDVCAALEMAVPRLDPGILKLLADGDIERVDHEREPWFGITARCCKSLVVSARATV